MIQENRKDLEEKVSAFLPLLPSQYAADVNREVGFLNRQAIDLRKRIGERIFELEKAELRPQYSGKTSFSKKIGHSHNSKRSNSSQISVMKIKTMIELAKRKVEMKYARIEAEKRWN